MQKLILCSLLFLFILTSKASYSITPDVDPQMSLEITPIKTKFDAVNNSNKKFKVFTQNTKLGEKVIIVDPNKHTWRAYAANGKLVRSGLATAGSHWCADIGRSCKTKAGVFRVYSLGSSGCKSRTYPVNRGGAPMPYCMYFNGGQGIHGSNQVVAGNLSHGCVRVHVSDAKWLRFNFVGVGTKVVVKAY